MIDLLNYWAWRSINLNECKHFRTIWSVDLHQLIARLHRLPQKWCWWSRDVVWLNGTNWCYMEVTVGLTSVHSYVVCNSVSFIQSIHHSILPVASLHCILVLGYCYFQRPACFPYIISSRNPGMGSGILFPSCSSLWPGWDSSCWSIVVWVY